MALALRLGRTLAELRAQMTAEEFSLWQWFDSESPISDDRGDFLAAMMASSAFQAQGGKVKLSDMLPNWSGEPAVDVGEAEDESEGEAGDMEGGGSFKSVLLSMAK
ncbi:DUF4035 domain-containing protein [Burkholderia sp. 22PA0099]|uniref:phage tail assembly protein T n=1 Tax=unclassified Burkholderia TaxID=2613784 RepID=UPI0039C3D2BC